MNNAFEPTAASCSGFNGAVADGKEEIRRFFRRLEETAKCPNPIEPVSEINPEPAQALPPCYLQDAALKYRFTPPKDKLSSTGCPVHGLLRRLGEVPAISVPRAKGRSHWQRLLGSIGSMFKRK
jgi:hypothetical protein